MKRSVAILGSTPSFVRWAINRPCAFREIYPQRLPETTFRQLRAIREVSVAESENRIHESICVHPYANANDADSALGFPIDEVVDLLGGSQLIADTCKTCPANAVAIQQPGLWAGCYGWFTSALNFDFRSVTLGLNHETQQNSLNNASNQGVSDSQKNDLIQLINRAAQRANLKSAIARTFSETTPIWFALWQSTVLNSDQLAILDLLIQDVIKHLKQLETNLSFQDLVRFADAISICRQHSFPLHAELVPAGHSDGLHWTIGRHCGRCKNSLMPTRKQCPACGERGNQRNEIKLKVLGIRPYLNLSQVYGREATQQFLRRCLPII